jgi:hypothetical protein
VIRRFIDPTAIFLYVAPSEVTAVAERFKATSFDTATASGTIAPGEADQFRRRDFYAERHASHALE